jgi:hypothetical protein
MAARFLKSFQTHHMDEVCHRQPRVAAAGAAFDAEFKTV